MSHAHRALVLLRRLGWSWIFPALGMYPSARRSAESDACRSWRGKSVKHRRSSERGDISKITQAVSIKRGKRRDRATARREGAAGCGGKAIAGRDRDTAYQ